MRSAILLPVFALCFLTTTALASSQVTFAPSGDGANFTEAVTGINEMLAPDVAVPDLAIFTTNHTCVLSKEVADACGIDFMELIGMMMTDDASVQVTLDCLLDSKSGVWSVTDLYFAKPNSTKP